MVIDIWVCCCSWTCFYLVDSSTAKEKGIQSEFDVNDFQERKGKNHDIAVFLLDKNGFLCATVFFPTPRAVCMFSSKRVDLKCQGGIEKKKSVIHSARRPSLHLLGVERFSPRGVRLFIFPLSRISCLLLFSFLPINHQLVPLFPLHDFRGGDNRGV